MEHTPVLFSEVIEGLHIQKNGIYVDCTLGRGGHSKGILSHLEGGKLIAFDQDQTAINESHKVLDPLNKDVTYVHSNFAAIKTELDTLGIHSVDGILMDLGVSSPQFDDGERGFSYRYNAKLDMRMNQEQSFSAYDIVNEYDVKELTRVFREYGEEPFAYEIAKMIVKEREKKPITTTFELVEVIKKALPQKILRKKGHPAKQVFQALRIEVNDELGVLKLALRDALSLLNVGGRLAVITFHSLEDRMVKKMMKEVSSLPSIPRGMPSPLHQEEPSYRLVNRHAIEASEEEQERNPRSKSAKLRIIERTKI